MSPAPGRKSNTGAIVGGIVGGIAAIAILAGIGFLLLRKRKSRDVALRDDNEYKAPRELDSCMLPGMSEVTRAVEMDAAR